MTALLLFGQWQHFDEYSDKKPNGENNYLAVNTKSEVYESYVEDIKVLGWTINVVPYKRFVDLWNCIFVKTKLRSWIDIPGKCHSCLAIDKLRRSDNTDKQTQSALKQLHHTHRGGLTMLERHRL